MLRPLDIEDELLADTLIERLNRLLENPDVRKDITRLIDIRVPISGATMEHSTIQVVPLNKKEGLLGFIGLLNGIVGVDPTLVGPRRGWGFISAEFDEEDVLVNFHRVKNKEQLQA